MGRILVLPRTHEQIEAVARYYPPERMPDFAARLHLWRQADAERRERFRRDMAIITDIVRFRVWAAIEPPQEGA